MGIGNRIKSIRGKSSRPKFADKIGISLTAVQNYETADKVPTGKVLKKIHEEFGVDINWILTGEGEPYPETLVGKPHNNAEPNESKVAPPGGELALHGGWKPQAKPEEWSLMGKAHKVLTSSSIYAQALATNINAFHMAIEQEGALKQALEKIDALENKYKELIDQILSLEKKSRGIVYRIRQDDSPALMGKVLSMRAYTAKDKVRKDDPPEKKDQLLALRAA